MNLPYLSGITCAEWYVLVDGLTSQQVRRSSASVPGPHVPGGLPPDLMLTPSSVAQPGSGANGRRRG